ncbi:stalk domain-containing protein [Aedoeadaptatus coxii]|uniref:stalk domain-containing protein n=1 Tax=Aedoeadaptatus coxii TaxID=755172 RepID=UPI002AD47F40|nr:stalk domain-containing protein [Peptoniphilus coxii]
MKHCKPYVFIFALVLFLLASAHPAEAAAIKENGRVQISPGVIRREMRVNVGGRNHIVDVIQVNLNNPYASLEVLAGAGTYTRKDTVLNMANRTDAYAAINGDFFNMTKQGAPFGPSVVGGKLQSSPLQSIGLYGFGVDGNRRAHIESFTFSGGAYASDGASYPISGLNKADYIINHTQVHSHKDAIQLYNDFWTARTRGLKGSGEVLVAGNGRVEKVSLNGPLPMATPKGKYILQVNGRAKDFIRKHVPVGSTLRLNYRVNPNRNWKFLIGGHALLVENGRPKLYTMDADSIDGVRARSAAAISKDGKTVYLLATEGRNRKSGGMRLAEWAAAVSYFGVDKAINLDGGGSTTMVARSHGDFKNTVIAHPERNAAQRRIVNGIGVMNKAPRTAVAGGEIAGPNSLVLGEVATYKLKKAWDSNYHPVQPTSVGYSLTDTAFGKNAWIYSRFLSPNMGKTNIVLTMKNGVTAQLPVTISSPAAMKSLNLAATGNGNRITLAPKGKTKNGRLIELDPNQMNWNVKNAQAAIDTESWKKPTGKGLNAPAAVFTLKPDGHAYTAIEATFGNQSAYYLVDSPGYTKLAMTVGKTAYTVAGRKMTMDTTPVIENSRTLVPLRFVLESYGADVQWNPEERTAIVHYKGKTLELPTDRKEARINGKSVPLDVGAAIRDDRTVIPLRFVAENLGMEVYYGKSDRTISIYEKQSR